MQVSHRPGCGFEGGWISRRVLAGFTAGWRSAEFESKREGRMEVFVFMMFGSYLRRFLGKRVPDQLGIVGDACGRAIVITGFFESLGMAVQEEEIRAQVVVVTH